jgi:tetratricopeptide (TPR) repeat protein
MSDALYERYKDALRTGHVAALRGRPEAALAAYADAASIAPDRPLPHASMAALLARHGRPEEALAAWDAALARAPGDEAATLGRADMLSTLGRRSEAAESLDGLSERQEAAGRLADACDTARHALELAESKGRRRHLDRLARRVREEAAGQPEAEAALGRAVPILELLEPPPGEQAPPLASAPRDAMTIAAEAEAALDAGRPDEARALYAEAALAHGRAGRFAAALDACYQALALGPDDVAVHLALVGLYADRGWSTLATDKLGLLGRLTALTGDDAARGRVRAVAAERYPDHPSLVDLRS